MFITFKIKKLLFPILSILVGMTFFCIGLEVYVRIMETKGENYDIEMWRYAKELKRPSNIPGVGHEHIPGKSGIYMGVPVTINSLGWRDSEHHLEKKDGTIRIMMLGDSLTFGWGAMPEEVTAFHLEKILNENNKKYKYEILNTGVGNTNTAMQAAYFLSAGYHYKPEILILNYYINDAEKTPTRKSNFFIENFYSAVFISSKYDIIARKFFKRGDWRQYYTSLYENNHFGWMEAKAALKRLSSYCRKNNIKLILVNYPELHQLKPYPFQEITDLVQSEAKALAIPFLDLLPSVEHEDPKSLWVTPTDAHPNGIAAKYYAAHIENFLKDEFREYF